MRKAFGLVLIGVLVMSLMGCGQGKATTTENTSTEVKTEATTKENLTTEATTTEAMTTETPDIDATSTDAKSTLTSDVKTDIIMITEKEEYYNLLYETTQNPGKDIILGQCGSESFVIYLADDGSNEFEINLKEYQEDSEVFFVFPEDSVESFSGNGEYYVLTTYVAKLENGVTQLSVTFKDGKTVNITVHVPEA